jgi:hypothetical protein
MKTEVGRRKTEVKKASDFGLRTSVFLTKPLTETKGYIIITLDI